jgi:hypothetical protein
MRILALGLLFLSSASFAADVMVRQDEAPTLGKDESLVVFLSPENPGEIRRITIHDVSTPAPKFVGFAESNSRLSYRVRPGKYTFMVSFLEAEFLEATVADGKTYYVVVSQNVGRRAGVMNRYYLLAIKGAGLADLDFVRLSRNATPMSLSESGERWGAARTRDFTAKKEKYWHRWLALPPQQRKLFVLEATDGR